jgi:hypothetical protein
MMIESRRQNFGSVPAFDTESQAYAAGASIFREVVWSVLGTQAPYSKSVHKLPTSTTLSLLDFTRDALVRRPRCVEGERNPKKMIRIYGKATARIPRVLNWDKFLSERWTRAWEPWNNAEVDWFRSTDFNFYSPTIFSAVFRTLEDRCPAVGGEADKVKEGKGTGRLNVSNHDESGLSSGLESLFSHLLGTPYYSRESKDEKPYSSGLVIRTYQNGLIHANLPLSGRAEIYKRLYTLLSAGDVESRPEPSKLFDSIAALAVEDFGGVLKHLEGRETMFLKAGIKRALIRLQEKRGRENGRTESETINWEHRDINRKIELVGRLF